MVTQTQLKQTFPELEQELIEELSDEGNFKTIPANTDLMRQGQNIRSTMLLLNGLVKVFREDDEGHEYLLYHVQGGEGCALSMTCMVGNGTSSVAAKTLQETDVVMLPIEKMDDWMNRYKSWYHFVVRSYRNRFEDLLQTLDSIAFRHMDERLELYLKRQAEIRKSNTIAITHHEIAQELNSSREVISRLLKKLSERGRVVLQRNAIELVG